MRDASCALYQTPSAGPQRNDASTAVEVLPLALYIKLDDYQHKLKMKGYEGSRECYKQQLLMSLDVMGAKCTHLPD